LKSDIRIDLSKLYEGQKFYNKSGLEYKKSSSSLSSNVHQNPKEKKQTQNYKEKMHIIKILEIHQIMPLNISLTIVGMSRTN
jgi:hypothetical protein